MTNLLSLALRCEQAEGPSRELDAEISCAVFGGEIVWKTTRFTMDSYPARRHPSSNYVSGFCNEHIPSYTASLDAALSLVPDGMEFELTNLYGVKRVGVGLNWEPGPLYASNECGSLSLALCAAALKARASLLDNTEKGA